MPLSATPLRRRSTDSMRPLWSQPSVDQLATCEPLTAAARAARGAPKSSGLATIASIAVSSKHKDYRRSPMARAANSPSH